MSRSIASPSMSASGPHVVGAFLSQRRIGAVHIAHGELTLVGGRSLRKQRIFLFEDHDVQPGLPGLDRAGRQRTKEAAAQSFSGRTGARQRPCDGKGRVVPAEAPLMVRHTVIGGLVQHFSRAAGDGGTMGEARWNPALAPVAGRQHDTQPSSEGGLTAPQVDRHVLDLARHHAHQLPCGR